MPSLRHSPSADDLLLDAARHCLLAVGWRRTTLTDVARRAGVSRMTIYRRWPDMRSLLADLMTREWQGVVDPSLSGAGGTGGESALDRLTDSVAWTVAALRDNALFRKIVQVDPELLLPYLLDRRGRTQDAVLAVLEAAIAEGQAAGTVRAGDPTRMARSVLLACHGFALSAATMTEERLTVADLDTELRALTHGYLRP